MRQPIGVFDSGVGGLAVVRELKNRLPKESVLYVADSRFFPYGTKSRADILARADALIGFLRSQGARIVVVACNTASSVIFPDIQRHVEVPVLGMISAGVKSAQLATRNHKVAVLATPATTRSHCYLRSMSILDPTVEMIELQSQELVNLVEQGTIDGRDVATYAAEVLRPVSEFGADTLVLGCTHFPFLNELMQRVLGPRVKIVDPSKELAYEVSLVMEKCRLLTEKGGEDRFLTTGDPKDFLEKARFFLGDYVAHVEVADV
ncbi:MAG: glutamate racemase [Caldisericota bacterium]|jgi:glutamate racemase|nr:glutamate racemase [Caldisericota bacterium]